MQLFSVMDPLSSSLNALAMASTSGRKLNIVVEGCCHGELPNIYASVHKMEQVRLSVSSNFLLTDSAVRRCCVRWRRPDRPLRGWLRL